MLTFFLCFRF